MKLHQCRYCDRTFARFEHVNRHERSHTKEKPYRCGLCPNAFTRRDLLTRHHRLYHLPEEGRHEATSQLQSFEAIAQERCLLAPSDVPYEDILTASNTIAAPISQELSASIEPTMQPPMNDVPEVEDIAQTLPTDFFDNYDWSAVFDDENFSDILDPSAFANSTDPFSRHRSPANINVLPLVMPVTPDREAQDLTFESSDVSRFGSRLPSLEPDPYRRGHERPDHSSPWTPSNPKRAPLEIDLECRQTVLTKLAEFEDVLPAGFQLPSRHALNRFLALYITGFNEHNPVLHLPTTSLESVAVELLLAMTSVGARYAHEKETCLDLLNAAEAIVQKRIKCWEEPQKICRPDKADNGTMWAADGDNGVTDWLHIQVMQALVMMTGDVVFGRSPGADSRNSSFYRATLGFMIRQVSPSIGDREVGGDWHEWAKVETLKRIVLVAFTLFNLHTMLLDIAPSLWWSEINLNLPCSEETWNATSIELWYETRSRAPPEVSVRDAIQDLYKEGTQPIRQLFSSLGGYFLIHAILQSMWIQSQMTSIQTSLPSDQSLDSQRMERALRRWRQGWECDRESSMNPVNPSGPIAFTSTALLRLAYVRLSTNVRIIPALRTWDHARMGTEFLQTPNIVRCERATRAALHCAHALSIPVKIGLKFVAHTQSFYWACQQSLSSLECAFYLSKWLETITDTQAQGTLTSQEALVLEYVVQIVCETELREPRAILLSDGHRLSRIIIELWGKVFPEAGVWEIIDLVAKVFRSCVKGAESTE